LVSLRSLGGKEDRTSKQTECRRKRGGDDIHQVLKRKTKEGRRFGRYFTLGE